MSIREELLQAFEGQAGRVISGEILAGKLNVSRTAVWKHIKALQSLGIPLESAERAGYRLKVPADASLFAFASEKHPWVIPHFFLSTSSTQTLAKAGAVAGLAEGHLWMAETQTKGRGRLDRRWESSYGGLWLSLLLRPKLPPSRVPPLTLIAGLCLRGTVEKVCGVEAKLKWPNDLLVRSRGAWKKCAGILTEMSGQMERTEWVVIGAGLNVNNAISPALAPQAASLYGLTGKIGSRAKVLELFLGSFQAAYARYQKEGFEPFRKAYWAHYYAVDKPLRLRTADGILSGIARGVDASGAIMIESDTHPSDAGRIASRRKMQHITEGEIILPSVRFA